MGMTTMATGLPAAAALAPRLGRQRRQGRAAGSGARHVQAIAADRELDSMLAHARIVDARRLAGLTHDEKLWQRQMSGSSPLSTGGDEPSVSPRVELAAALETCRWEPSPGFLPKRALWARVRAEAQAAAGSEPVLASFLHMTVIMHASLEKSTAFLLANKLASGTLLSTQLVRLFMEAYEDDASILDAGVADMQAVFDRDPACETHLQCMLFFKGWQAIQAHRVAHWMWDSGRRSLAVALQSRMSEVFSVDIHPAAKLGRGVMLDHATGVVIGETAVIGDNVSMLHHVTLGGSGTGKGTRHPTIGNGVLLGAGVSVLGPVVVGQCTKVGAGSVVMTDLPPHCVAVGVPAKVVKHLDPDAKPVEAMDQCLDFVPDYII